MTKELITAEDVRHGIEVFVGMYGECLDAANIEVLTGHLHGNLAMIAEARAGKQLKKGEALAKAAMGLETVVAFAIAEGIDHIGEQELIRMNDALAAYREAAS